MFRSWWFSGHWLESLWLGEGEEQETSQLSVQKALSTHQTSDLDWPFITEATLRDALADVCEGLYLLLLHLHGKYSKGFGWFFFFFWRWGESLCLAYPRVYFQEPKTQNKQCSRSNQSDNHRKHVKTLRALQPVALPPVVLNYRAQKSMLAVGFEVSRLIPAITQPSASSLTQRELLQRGLEYRRVTSSRASWVTALVLLKWQSFLKMFSSL